MTTLVEDRRAPPACVVEPTWEELEGTYRCQALLCPESDGGFAVFARRLPGVASQGETEEEALSNLAEAFRGAIQMYLEDGGSIPWQDIDKSDIPKGSVERWILVDV